MAAFLLRQYDKHASQGKQSAMKRLVRQNRGVTNVEIQQNRHQGVWTAMPSGIDIDYAIQQRPVLQAPPRYLVYFKAQDTDALSAAFKEYSASVLDKDQASFRAGKAA